MGNNRRLFEFRRDFGEQINVETIVFLHAQIPNKCCWGNISELFFTGKTYELAVFLRTLPKMSFGEIWNV